MTNQGPQKCLNWRIQVILNNGRSLDSLGVWGGLWFVDVTGLDLALLTLSWDKNWDSHSLVNGYPSFYPRIALVAPSLGVLVSSARWCDTCLYLHNSYMNILIEQPIKYMGHGVKSYKRNQSMLFFLNSKLIKATLVDHRNRMIFYTNIHWYFVNLTSH